MIWSLTGRGAGFSRILVLLFFLQISAGFCSDSLSRYFGLYSNNTLGEFESFEDEYRLDLKYICLNISENHFERYEGTSVVWSYFVDRSGKFFSTEDGRNLVDRSDLRITVTLPLAFSRSPTEELDASVRALRLKEVASGVHDGFYRAVAEAFLEGGHGDAIFRMGHEFNGWGYPWLAKGGNAGHYIDAWRHVHGLMSSVSDEFLFDYNMDRGGYSDSLANDGVDIKALAFPGSDYVDVVGTDIYDNGDNEMVVKYLNEAYQFAVLHNKRFSIPEFGLWRGGDNVEFIETVLGFLKEKLREDPGRLLYFNYFNRVGYHELSDFPNSRDRMLELIGLPSIPGGLSVE